MNDTGTFFNNIETSLTVGQNNITVSNLSHFEKELKFLNSQNETTTRIFVICLIGLITIANVLMGCELDLHVVWTTCRKPIAPVIGLFTQFFVMPILSYCIAKTVFRSPGEETFGLGLFVTGCAPAGAASNFWTILFDGNTHLSITMTFISTIFALGMMPLWMNFLGFHFVQSRVHVPYAKIIIALLALVIPLMIGVIIARLKPNVAQRARKILRPFVIFVLAFVIIFGTISNLYMLKLISWSTFIAGMLLPWLGFTCGCFAAIIMRQEPADVAAIAIETGIQNTGIAIMLLKISFPGVQGDVSALMPVIVACCTPIPLLACYIIHVLVKRAKIRQQSLRVSENVESVYVRVDPDAVNGRNKVKFLPSYSSCQMNSDETDES